MMEKKMETPVMGNRDYINGRSCAFRDSYKFV